MTKKDEKFNELVNFQPPEIKEWIVKMDKLLIGGGCKAAVDNKGNFTYTSKQSGKIVCRITMGETGCSVRPNTINTKNAINIAAAIPQNMLEEMRNTRGCGGCEAKNPNFVQCKHGGPYQFTCDNEDFESCRYVGFNFTLDDALNRDVLENWLEYELALGHL